MLKFSELVKQLENQGFDLRIRDGLTCDEIETLEEVIGSSFDDQTKHVYSLCGGQDPGAIPVFGRFRLLPPAEVIHMVEEMKIYPPFGKEDPTGNERLHRDRFWRSGWLFFAKDVHGMYLIVDFSPRKPDYAGHIFLWNPETPFDETVATSVKHLVELSMAWDNESNDYFEPIPLNSIS